MGIKSLKSEKGDFS